MTKTDHVIGYEAKRHGKSIDHDANNSKAQCNGARRVVRIAGTTLVITVILLREW